MGTMDKETKEEKKAIINMRESIKKESAELKESFREDFAAGKKEIKQTISTTIDPNGDSHISLGEIFGEMFSIKKDVASLDQIKETLVSGGHVTGTNMCLLVLAIFIASIGLNVNSTAVIIGAMLISPLMGTIQATAYGTATSDVELSIRSLLGFFAQVFISLCTSTLYFAISPLSDKTSELLARTQPTIWDVMIAIFGGLAGIIGVTRKEKSNVIPGVAIATALMPPLCTCGYSIAHGQWRMLLGAGYLFIANSYFIYLSATIILIALGVPRAKVRDEKRRKRLKKALIRNTIIIIIPSIIMAYFMVQRAVVDDTKVTGFETAIDVRVLTKEMEVLFPEVEEVAVGQLTKLSENENTVEQKVILLKTEEAFIESENQEECKKIRDWLKERYEEYEVEFE
ncbi:MAG: TIGR00341 family protein [Lachnospiraceae bacterium]